VSRAQAVTAGKVLVLLVIGALLQNLVVSRVTVLGVGADLFLIFTVIVAIVRGPLWGAVFGFVIGLAADIDSLQHLGLHSLVYVVLGYVVGMLAVRFGIDSLWIVFLYAGGASLAAQLVFGLLEFIMNPRSGLFAALGTQLLPEALLDALVALPVFLLIMRLRLLPPARGEPVQAGREGQ
jgi:rod shape-determining protein MreD